MIMLVNYYINYFCLTKLNETIFTRFKNVSSPCVVSPSLTEVNMALPVSTTKTVTPLDTSVTNITTDIDDLDAELELDLENVKLDDNIDTSVSILFYMQKLVWW